MDTETNEEQQNDERPKKKILLQRGEKIRIIKAGPCFSGPSAFPSNMHFAPITVNNREFDSNEQAYQHDKAVDHGLEKTAKEIKESKNAYDIKDKSHKITTTLEWESAAPEKIWGLLEKKFQQQPNLLERLLDTYPLPLIEASPDTRNLETRDSGGYPSVPITTKTHIQPSPDLDESNKGRATGDKCDTAIPNKVTRKHTCDTSCSPDKTY